MRGGGPFSGLEEQGFADGLYTDSNGTDQGGPAAELATLLHRSDWIRTGLAGELAGFQLEDASGNTVAASQIDYQGQPAGYTAEPQDVINYAEAHDNETLFDAIQEKAPAAATTAERVRMQNLGVSLVALGQGIPFFHAESSSCARSRSTGTATTPATGSTGSTGPGSRTTGASACRRRRTTRRIGRSSSRSSPTRP